MERQDDDWFEIFDEIQNGNIEALAELFERTRGYRIYWEDDEIMGGNHGTQIIPIRA